MRLIFFIISLLLFASKGFAQAVDSSDARQIKLNIFRLTLNQPIQPLYETNLILAGHFERRLNDEFSLLTKLGMAAIWDRLGSPEHRFRSTGHIYGGLEARYFFLSQKRVRKSRPILNFTGPYAALEQSVFTNPVFLINRSFLHSFKGRTLTHLNFGYQKQSGHFYFGFNAGALLWSKSLYNDFDNYSWWHGNVAVGYVFL